jgi:hypothetical protein
MKEINMTRHEGGKDVSLVELTDRQLQKYIVRTDLQSYKTEEADGMTFIECCFDYKPSLDDIKWFVLGVINEKVKSRILSGYVWNNKPIWLSEENQMNWSQAVVPATFKIGEDNDGTPIYHTFSNEEDMAAFNEGWRKYIQECLQDGWTEKDSVDWGPYENSLRSV